jgi:hypothetical protein
MTGLHVRVLTKRRWRIDGGLVVAAIIVGVFLWTVFYLLDKTSY